MAFADESHSIAHSVPETGSAVRIDSTTMLMVRWFKPTLRVYREAGEGLIPKNERHSQRYPPQPKCVADD